MKQDEKRILIKKRRKGRKGCDVGVESCDFRLTRITCLGRGSPDRTKLLALYSDHGYSG